jgi:hypothetical protein
VAVVSAPYVNGVRRLAAPLLRQRQRRLAARGAEFYQYAFTRGELREALRRHGLEPVADHPYDPARLLRGALRRLRPRRGAGGGGGWAAGTAEPVRRSPAVAAGRRLLYTQVGLRLLGHMLLVVAIKR